MISLLINHMSVTADVLFEAFPSESFFPYQCAAPKLVDDICIRTDVHD